MNSTALGAENIIFISDAPAERTSLKAKLEMMKAKVAGGETEKSMPQKIKGKEETYEIF